VRASIRSRGNLDPFSLVAPPRSTQRILDVLGSRDKTYRLAPGGHIGVVAGSKAPHAVWDPAIEWLVDRILRKRA
jgi:polyhydroxyalkanoate synthase